MKVLARGWWRSARLNWRSGHFSQAPIRGVEDIPAVVISAEDYEATAAQVDRLIHQIERPEADVARRIEEVVQKEREACAQIAETVRDCDIPIAIRSRGCYPPNDEPNYNIQGDKERKP